MPSFPDVITTPCAGIDIHKKVLSVCVISRGPDGNAERSVAEFSTKRRNLLNLRDWLQKFGVTHVAIESTANYWCPVFDVLETAFEVCLVNPRYARPVQGKKTDTADCIWLADLLRKGMLRNSFIPPQAIRDLRDLTRLRTVRIEHAVKVTNELRQTLEKAHIKLDSVVSDVLGVSGRAMLEALTKGKTDPEELANLAQRRLRGKIPELRAALDGRMNEHYRFLLSQHWDLLQALEKQIAKLEEEIERHLPPFEWAVQLLCTAPGIKRIAAVTIIAEIGVDMKCFLSAGHLASWAGLCPGNYESAGKHHSVRNPRGNRFIKKICVQVALGASQTRTAYARALYHRIARRRGKGRAILAVANSMIRSVWHMLTHRVPYKDLGVDYYQADRDQIVKGLIRKLERYGHKVVLQPAA